VSEDLFSALGAPRRFAQDLVALEKRYYQLSRELHPDRFTLEPSDVRARVLEKMSRVNEAYRTLRDRGLLREYLLSLHGISAGGGKPPAELAEEWFDAQDDRASAERFRSKLAEKIAAEDRALAEAEHSADLVLEAGTEPRAALEAVAAHVRALSYLKSMDRDAARLLDGGR
jgi:molecular chaperone HscB